MKGMDKMGGQKKYWEKMDMGGMEKTYRRVGIRRKETITMEGI